ncbi:MAG: sensor histidine kinase [Nocardioides sp.]
MPARGWDRLRVVVPGRIDTAIACGLLALAQAEVWLTTGYEPGVVYAVAAAGMTVPLAWRRRAPIVVCIFVLLVLVAMEIVGHPQDPAYVMAVLIVALYSVGAYRSHRPAIAGWVGAMALIAALIAVEEGPGAGDFVFVGAIVTGAWGLGLALRSRGQENAALVERTAELEQTRESFVAEALAEERAHIARELHDVIAHSVSIVIVQTAAVRRRLQADRPGDAEQLEGIEQTARQAMREMRRLLGVLVQDESLELTPQPGLGDLPALLEQMRRAGMQVEHRIEGEPSPLPAGLDLAAYRVVQEGLVNVLKHAGGARAEVVTSYGVDELALSVTNTGNDGPAAVVGLGGHGLIGMRERVHLYGGTLTATAEPDGAFAVRARLPLGAG